MTKYPESFEGLGFTKEDWDEVSDTPQITLEGLMKAKRFEDIFPELAAKQRGRGRPKSIGPKQAVTMRLKPETVALFKLQGEDWRMHMANALEKAALELVAPGNPHPGKVLRDLFMAPRNLTVPGLASAAQIPEQALEALLREEAPVTAGLSIYLATFFEVTPGFWLRLQEAHDAANPARPRARRAG